MNEQFYFTRYTHARLKTLRLNREKLRGNTITSAIIISRIGARSFSSRGFRFRDYEIARRLETKAKQLVSREHRGGRSDVRWTVENSKPDERIIRIIRSLGDALRLRKNQCAKRRRSIQVGRTDRRHARSPSESLFSPLAIPSLSFFLSLSLSISLLSPLTFRITFLTPSYGESTCAVIL